MVEPVEVAAFNPFDPAHSAGWHALRQRFARDADDVEMATRDLIDSCFRGLRSVDAAVQLLHSFQRIHVGGVGRGGGGVDVQAASETWCGGLSSSVNQA